MEGNKYLRTMYYEQKGLINLDDIVDIFIEVGNIHNYLENAALRILLFGNPELNFYQCLVPLYGLFQLPYQISCLVLVLFNAFGITMYNDVGN